MYSRSKPIRRLPTRFSTLKYAKAQQTQINFQPDTESTSRKYIIFSLLFFIEEIIDLVLNFKITYFFIWAWIPNYLFLMPKRSWHFIRQLQLADVFSSVSIEILLCISFNLQCIYFIFHFLIAYLYFLFLSVTVEMKN